MRKSLLLRDVFSRLELYGITLREFSLFTKISDRTLRYLCKEKGDFPLSSLRESTRNKIEKGLRHFIGMDILIDYFRVRFDETDCFVIMKEVLGLKPKHFYCEEKGYWGYTSVYRQGDIIVLNSDDEQLGTLIELRGKGCRQFEAFLEAQGRTWLDFFNVCLLRNGIPKRIDFAVNDRAGLLDVSELSEKMDNGEVQTIFRSHQSVRSGGRNPYREDRENTAMGNTLYLGSMKSEIYFCIYEKDYERLAKEGTSLEEAEIVNRFELRLSDGRAQKAVDLLIEKGEDEIENLVFGIINRYVTFLDKNEKEDKRNWEINEDWANFIGEDRARVRLGTKPKPFELRSTKNWISHSVFPTLKFLVACDEITGTEEMKKVYESTELSKKYRAILESESLPISERIYEEKRSEVFSEEIYHQNCFL